MPRNYRQPATKNAMALTGSMQLIAYSAFSLSRGENSEGLVISRIRLRLRG